MVLGQLNNDTNNICIMFPIYLYFHKFHAFLYFFNYFLYTFIHVYILSILILLSYIFNILYLIVTYAYIIYNYIKCSNKHLISLSSKKFKQKYISQGNLLQFISLLYNFLYMFQKVKMLDKTKK